MITPVMWKQKSIAAPADTRWEPSRQYSSNSIKFKRHLLHFAWVVDDAKCIVVTRVCVCVCLCLCVCLPVRGPMPTLSHGPGCNFEEWQGMSLSCALLGGFAIGAHVALLWQHNANPSYYKLASTPRYDDIVRTRNVSECSLLALCIG